MKHNNFLFSLRACGQSLLLLGGFMRGIMKTKIFTGVVLIPLLFFGHKVWAQQNKRTQQVGTPENNTIIWMHQNPAVWYGRPLGYDSETILLGLGVDGVPFLWHYPSGTLTWVDMRLVGVSEDGTMTYGLSSVLVEGKYRTQLVIFDTRTGDEIRRVFLPDDPDCQVTSPYGIPLLLSPDFSRGVMGGAAKLLPL